jgi:lysozyme family protein
MPFEDVYSETKLFEGGYVNDKDDPGQETFRGISRVSWPAWEGWKLIDTVKKTLGTSAVTIDRTFENDKKMENLVDSFYKVNFWDKINPQIPDLLRQKIFDTMVNVGTKNAYVILQRALNTLGAVLNVDGIIGPRTLNAIERFPIKELLLAYSKRQENYYKDLANRKPQLTKFLRAWLKRAAWLPKVQ